MECYKSLVKVPKPNTTMIKPWDVGDNCNNMNISNVQTRPDGGFLKFAENMYSDKLGLWGNFVFNTETPNGTPLETYSNLQGAWSRIGPSTYDALHSHGDPYNRWGAGAFLPMPLKSLYDHPNADPKGMWRPDHYKPKCPHCANI